MDKTEVNRLLDEMAHDASVVLALQQLAQKETNIDAQVILQQCILVHMQDMKRLSHLAKIAIG